MAITEQLLLSRSPTSAPAIFICLGHQLAAQGHINLIQRAVDETLNIKSLNNDPDHSALDALQRICRKIKAVGNQQKVIKNDGRTAADSWHDIDFAVTENEVSLYLPVSPGTVA